MNPLLILGSIIGCFMKIAILVVVSTILLAGCASKEFDQESYDRQNKAAEKSLNSLDKEK